MAEKVRDYPRLAKDIVRLVGGDPNIAAVQLGELGSGDRRGWLPVRPARPPAGDSGGLQFRGHPMLGDAEPVRDLGDAQPFDEVQAPQRFHWNGRWRGPGWSAGPAGRCCPAPGAYPLEHG